jgi:hypothetical protein
VIGWYAPTNRETANYRSVNLLVTGRDLLAVASDGYNRSHQQNQTGTMSNPIRILVVDDHPILRQGLSALLANEPDMSLMGEASN